MNTVGSYKNIVYLMYLTEFLQKEFGSKISRIMLFNSVGTRTMNI